MAKKLQNMTDEERIAHWHKERQKAYKLRQDKIDNLDADQIVAVTEVHKWLDKVLDVALYPDMGGIRMVPAYELQELSDAKDVLENQFNLRGE